MPSSNKYEAFSKPLNVNVERIETGMGVNPAIIGGGHIHVFCDARLISFKSEIVYV